MLDGLTFLDSHRQMPGMKLHVRSTAVALGAGTVLLSPGSRLSPDELARAGAVTDIVAPNLFHCAGVPGAHRVFPSARLWGPAGAEKVRPELPWSARLGETEWPYQAELSVIHLGGMPKVRETVFVHHKSRTLVVGDLCFNEVDAAGLGARFFGTLFGTYRRFATSRFFTMFVKDRAAFSASLRELWACDFVNVVPCHGEAVLGDGKQRLAAALAERGFTV